MSFNVTDDEIFYYWYKDQFGEFPPQDEWKKWKKVVTITFVKNEHDNRGA